VSPATGVKSGDKPDPLRLSPDSVRCRVDVRRWTLPLAFAAILLMSCGHTEPFVTGNYGAVGPLTGAQAGQLTLFGGGPGRWLADGRGILYRNNGGCFAVLPAGGGSAIWVRCESREPVIRDSAHWTEKPALAPDGRLIYTGCVGRKDYPYPVGFHCELWLTDSATGLLVRRKLLTLYHDVVGRPTVGPDEVNMVGEVAWSGQDEFVARGQNLSPNGTTTDLRLVRGTITATGASLGAISGTERARVWSLVGNTPRIVFTRDALTLESASITGSGAQVLVTLVGINNRSIQDISCPGSKCLILTQETTPAREVLSSLWIVDLSDNSVLLLRTFSAEIIAAQWSPVSTDLLTTQRVPSSLVYSALFLIRGLLP
jgi:hypothetical protein